MPEQDRTRTVELGRPDRSRLPELGRPDKSRMIDFGRHVEGDMVVVEAGEFLMGSTDADSDADSDEQPQHTVYLDAYTIDVHPVTVAQYRGFCEDTGKEMPSAPGWGWLDDHPIVNMTWHDATAYSEWADKRLPTEAEWEKAARGVDGRIFPWGNEWNPRAAHCDYEHHCEHDDQTAPVGSHAEGVSPYGCQDMIGNVWEWCADWFDNGYYCKSPRENPGGPRSGKWRVLRGGSWATLSLGGLRCADRGWSLPANWDDNRGFRCAQDLG